MRSCTTASIQVVVKALFMIQKGTYKHITKILRRQNEF